MFSYWMLLFACVGIISATTTRAPGEMDTGAIVSAGRSPPLTGTIAGGKVGVTCTCHTFEMTIANPDAPFRVAEAMKAEVREAFFLFDKPPGKGLDGRELRVALRALGMEPDQAEIGAWKGGGDVV